MASNKVVERYARKLAPLTTDVGIKSRESSQTWAIN
jgi:hypothetical protein